VPAKRLTTLALATLIGGTLGTIRARPTSDVPTLVLSGTLAGRTYLEEQREALAGLSGAHIMLVRNAGHNLFMTSPAVTARLESFMRSETVSTADIVVALAIAHM
jgi:pimeloyl-ACP methyl ester carboxylesterase